MRNFSELSVFSTGRVAVAALVCLWAAGAAQAATVADVSVVERSSGRVLPLYRHAGEYWVAGRPGAHYAIRVLNTTHQRILGVVSVDGLNVLNGKAAVAAPRDGYVWGVGDVSDITGWRKSMEQVAAFYFSESSASYASRTGRPQDVGVIGVALFREQPPPAVTWRESSYPREELAKNSARADAAVESVAPAAAAPAPSSAAAKRAPTAESASRAAPAPSLGTGHGAVESAQVSWTEFVSATERPVQVVRIRYDSYANLVAKGIIPAPRQVPPRGPRAFPGSDGFVPDPPAY